ncbi:MAG: PfkB family carbohydrate kinase [Sulfuritalea sp.]|nr:PfkB family carbohydrate kinase [Sulfuritalea sp.]
MRPILVVGSAHLDVLARALHRDDVIDRIGEVSIEFGGTACNIAINLAHAGAPVRLLTAMNDSPYSAAIVAYVASMGVEPHVEYSPDLPSAGFSAHIDTRGEMVSAISSMPVERVNFDGEKIAALLNGTAALIVDCNLSALAISRLATFANDRGIPVYVSAVSEEKSLRIAAISARLDGIFINQNEFRFFCRQVLGARKSVGEAARIIGAALLVTEGAHGSTLALPDGTETHIPAPEVNADGSRLGMGDAMAAGVVFLHELLGLPLPEAALKSLKLVASVGASPHCHKGKPGALETAIHGFQHHASHDAMTDIPNRRRIELELSKSLSRVARGTSKSLAVLMVDIDHFKSVNDTYGHNVGDQVIIAVARIIKECLRDIDTAGRWGGEEFVIVLPDTAVDAAALVAERIRSSIEARIKEPRPITVSLGCAETDSTTPEDMEALIGKADQALYRAKKTGRNRVAAWTATTAAV